MAKKVVTNRFLSTRAYNLLVKIRDDEDQELTYEKGAGWWVGCNRVSSAAAKDLLIMCLLHADSHNRVGQFEIYTPNSEVEKVLSDPEYVPLIIAAFKKQREKEDDDHRQTTEAEGDRGRSNTTPQGD